MIVKYTSPLPDLVLYSTVPKHLRKFQNGCDIPGETIVTEHSSKWDELVDAYLDLPYFSHDSTFKAGISEVICRMFYGQQKINEAGESI